MICVTTNSLGQRNYRPYQCGEQNIPVTRFWITDDRMRNYLRFHPTSCPKPPTVCRCWSSFIGGLYHIEYGRFLTHGEHFNRVGKILTVIATFFIYGPFHGGTAISVVSALVSSRFDYANSGLFGCPQKHIARLQWAQHALARVVTQVLSFPFTYIYRSSQTAPLAAHRMANQVQTCLINL